MALSSLPGTEGQSCPAPTGDSFHRMSNPGREAQIHHGFKTKTMEYRMLLMYRTNESSPRQLKSSILLRECKSKGFLNTKHQLTNKVRSHDWMMSSIQVWTRDNHSPSKFSYFSNKLNRSSSRHGELTPISLWRMDSLHQHLGNKTRKSRYPQQLLWRSGTTVTPLTTFESDKTRTWTPPFGSSAISIAKATSSLPSGVL